MTVKRSKLKFEYTPIEKLKDNPHSTRIHTKQQIRGLAKSIKSFGFNRAVLIDQSGTIIAGGAVVKAAKELKLAEVPTILQEDLSPDQARAYSIADNKWAERSQWDQPALASEFKYLLNVDLEFNIEDIGFPMAEIDVLLSPPDIGTDAEDAFEIEQPSTAVTQVGDLWRMGKHQVHCADALDKVAYSKLFGKKRAAVGFFDPPYNVPISGHVLTNNGSTRHREFLMAGGDMTEEQFTNFLAAFMALAAEYSNAGALQYVCMDWRHSGEVLAAGKRVYDSLINTCVWAKNVGGMGSLYRSQYELIYVFRNGKAKHQNNIQLGVHGRNRTNLWNYPSINTLSKCGEEGNLLALHPTVKPVALVADALLDCSSRGGVVLDAFLGSGTTVLAAERTGRICYGIELDPLYIDTAIKRWQRHTGDHAIHVESGKTFNDLAMELEEVAHG